MHTYTVAYLQELEAESIQILREAVAQFDKPVLLFSGGKDSILVSYLAKKAFRPNKIPFPIMHIDTGHNFPEALSFRDWHVQEYLGAELIVASVQETIDQGKAQEETGVNASRNKIQSITLLDAIEQHGFDLALGGARRDEEKARAKERFFSHRDAFGQRDPKNQRPELRNIYNCHKQQGEHFRAFPISNWTEMDVWQYIKQEQIKLPDLYFAHQRKCFVRDGVILADNEYMQRKDDESLQDMTVRFRTLGDMTCTGAFVSQATTIDEIIEDLHGAQTAERGGRFDDKRSKSAMEDRKKQGYF